MTYYLALLRVVYWHSVVFLGPTEARRSRVETESGLRSGMTAEDEYSFWEDVFSAYSFILMDVGLLGALSLVVFDPGPDSRLVGAWILVSIGAALVAGSLTVALRAIDPWRHRREEGIRPPIKLTWRPALLQLAIVGILLTAPFL